MPVNDSEVVPDVVIIERDGDAEGELDPSTQRGGACCSSHTPEMHSPSELHKELKGRIPASLRARNADESNIRRRGRISPDIIALCGSYAPEVLRLRACASGKQECYVAPHHVRRSRSRCDYCDKMGANSNAK